MNDDLLVRVEGVSKKFCLSLKKSRCYGMQDLGNERIGRLHGVDGELRADALWAAEDVSFALKQGGDMESIGRNTLGKAKRPQTINEMIQPDQRRIGRL